jgi:hypothetical protein
MTVTLEEGLPLHEWERLAGKEAASIHFNGMTLLRHLEEMISETVQFQEGALKVDEARAAVLEDKERVAMLTELFEQTAKEAEDARLNATAEFLPFTEIDSEEEDGGMDTYYNITTKSMVADDTVVGPSYNNGTEFNQPNIDTREYEREQNGRFRTEENDSDWNTSDFHNCHRRKPMYSHRMYMRNGQWCDNIRIMMASGTNQILGVPEDWKPTEEWDSFELKKFVALPGQFFRKTVQHHEDQWCLNPKTKRVNLVSVVTHSTTNTFQKKVPALRRLEDGKKEQISKTIKYRTKAGISFRGSKQLAPKANCAYSNNADYAIFGTPAALFKARFLQHLAYGTVNTCQYVDENKVKKRQAWKMMTLPTKIDGEIFMKRCIVFTDIQ